MRPVIVMAVACVAASACAAGRDRHPIFEVNVGGDVGVPAKRVRGETNDDGAIVAVGGSYARRRARWLYGGGVDGGFVRDGGSHYYVGGFGGLVADHGDDEEIHTELAAELGWHHLRALGDEGEHDRGFDHYSLFYGGLRATGTRDMLPNIAVGVSARVRSDFYWPTSEIEVESCMPLPCATRSEEWQVGGLDASILLTIRYVGERPE